MKTYIVPGLEQVAVQTCNAKIMYSLLPVSEPSKEDIVARRGQCVLRNAPFCVPILMPNAGNLPSP